MCKKSYDMKKISMHTMFMAVPALFEKFRCLRTAVIFENAIFCTERGATVPSQTRARFGHLILTSSVQFCFL